jgi:hypothetical protein
MQARSAREGRAWPERGSGAIIGEMRDSRASLADAMYARLVPLWPEALPLLRHGSCFELLCAVILSAQCTDEQVNRITPRLFAAWPDPASLSKAPVAEVEEAIHSAGFFRTKARHLIESSRIIEERHGGDVPATMEGLLAGRRPTSSSPPASGRPESSSTPTSSAFASGRGWPRRGTPPSWRR